MYLEPCQTSKIGCLTKKVNRFKSLTIFTKQSILEVWQGSGYASGSFKLFCRGFNRDTREGWYMSNWLWYSLQTKNFPLFQCHTWKYNIQANERLTRVKEKQSTIKLDVFVLSFIFFVPMYQTKSFINRSGTCYFLHASN